MPSVPLAARAASLSGMTAQPRVISVNVGQPNALQVGSRTTVTGINKHAVPGRVRVTEKGLEGDHVLNHRYHGGPDQAVYVYTREDYDHWTEVLGRPLNPGIFGENLVVGGLESARVRVGDRLEISAEGGAPSVILEVTAPRIPCSTLGAQMGDAGFVKRFTRAGRPGFYTRVLQGGEVGRGDVMAYTPTEAADAPTIGELFDLSTTKTPDAAALERVMTAPLSVRLRRDLEEKLIRVRG